MQISRRKAYALILVCLLISQVLVGCKPAQKASASASPQKTEIKQVKKDSTLKEPQDVKIEAELVTHVKKTYHQTMMKEMSAQLRAAAFKITKKTLTVQAKVKAANVRKAPGLTQPIVTHVTHEQALSVDEEATNGDESWYHIKVSGKTGWISAAIIQPYKRPSSAEKRILNAPVYSQMPELQRGCEVTSLAMLLNYDGLHTSKMTLAKQIKKNPTPHHRKDGKIYYGNPNNGFVGNIYTFKKPGLGVYHGPVYQLARKYLGSKAVDLTGHGFKAVIQQINHYRPVWVIVSSTYAYLPAAQWMTFYTPSGPIKISYHEHSVLVTGYDEHYIYFNDPLTGRKNRRATKGHFISSWKQFGEQAISYR